MRKFGSIFLTLFLLINSFVLAQEKSLDLQPKITGDARTWYDVDLTKNQGNFLIRNARIMFTGNASEAVSYKFLFDLAALTKTTTKSAVDTSTGQKFLTDATTDLSIVNDAYISVKPIAKLGLTLGQFKVPFSTENLISTNSLPFSNRPLLSSKVAPDIYDIGFMASYTLPLPIEVNIDAAAFNGAGQNKSETDKTDNYAFRAVIKPFEGLNISGNYSGGVLSGKKVKIYDIGAGYKSGNLTVAGEYGNRSTNLVSSDVNVNAYFGYAIYDMPVDCGFLKFISPAIRYEYCEPNSTVNNDEVKRLTAGLTFSFAKITFAHFRVNYENFFYKDEYKGTDKSSDRLVCEFQVRF
jgi:hypothetical protein